MGAQFGDRAARWCITAARNYANFCIPMAMIEICDLPIPSRVRQRNATQDALEILEEDSETSIAILEARIADREAQLYGGLMPSEASRPKRSSRIEDVGSLRRSLPAEASRITHTRLDVLESELEEEVERIANKLEEVQTSISHISARNLCNITPAPNGTVNNILDGIRIDPTNFPSESMDVPEAGNALKLDVTRSGSGEVTSAVHRSPKSPRFKSVLRDLDAEIDRLASDLHDLKVERETMLELSGDPKEIGLKFPEAAELMGLNAGQNRGGEDMEHVKERESPSPHHMSLPPDSPEDTLTSYDVAFQDDSDQSDTSVRPSPIIQAIRPGPIDPAALQRQLADAQTALMAKEVQLRRLQDELEDMLIDQNG
ncbi:hypothetical protein CALCODRAFT_509888 [Calocera cornea HHB12733]|uniref:Uncharacterized protein n=1 Tax=Calocera cornea HHB12733 TaxID=1353952 RepID=A0A165EZ16_9BASI|nr:hypothetical protein CALCODRAFT_509888 [Calocera cornea HHB12733]